MTALIARALGLGLAVSFSCFGFCLPVALPVLFGTSQPGIKRSAWNLGLFLFGRFSAYLAFGLLFGVIGARLSGFAPLRTIIIPFTYLLLGLLLFIYGIVALDPLARIRLCRLVRPPSDSYWFVLLLGFLVGISPCPPFLLGIATVVDFGGIKNGIFFFLIFFIATSLFFLPLLLAGFVNRFHLVHTASRILALITGGYFILLGLRLFW
ncbi:MAG: urease accessory protein UreH domain-containing protein [bacterium]